MARRCYVRPALRARVTHLCAAGLAGSLVALGCGGERQDENERGGDFPVEVVSASFPEKQRLGQSSKLRITVRNAGDETIPNIGVSLKGFNYRSEQPGLADPGRPVFAIDGEPVRIGTFPEEKNAAPRGCDTAYVETWACGPLRPAEEKTFRWTVTAVRPGDFDVRWTINAGLDGNAKAVRSPGGDERPTGSLAGRIERAAASARIGDDGKTVVSGP